VSGLWRIVVVTFVMSLYWFCIGAGAIDASLLGKLAGAFGTSYFVALWVVADARKLGYTPAFDYGLYVWMAGLLVVPYYVLKTRGRSGFRLMLALLGLLLSPTIAEIAGTLSYYLWVAR